MEGSGSPAEHRSPRVQLKRELAGLSYQDQLARVRPPDSRPAASGGQPAVQLTEEEGDEPVAEYVIPFDHAPLSAPGECILFGARYRSTTPQDYELHYTSTGGHFDKQGSGTTTKTFPGLNQRNISFYIDPAWDGTTDLTVTLEMRKAADQTVLQTESWKFGIKVVYPETIEQKEDDGERPNPAVYHYKLGPDRNANGSDNYLHQTILETFGRRSSNLALNDLKEEYRTAHSLTSDQAVTDHFFGTSSNNGTFTVSAGDAIADQHSGMQGGDPAVYKEALTSYPRDVYVDLPQAYEAKPGVALGHFNIRRILKANGARVIRKSATK